MATSTKIAFTNAEGQRLDGVLESPDNITNDYALYAHCFTCSKEIAAAVRIARALADIGVAVLRFDFAGLGKSDGDFSATSFSSNVSDLKYAAQYMKHNFSAPRLLIGHSLGGAAVLAAAADIESVKAVATIGAPAEPVHVQHLFENEVEKIRAQGEAEIEIAGRDFTITSNFLDDIESYDLKSKLAVMHRALLVMHSPTDEIVPVVEARKIFEAAKHPKSFIALDGADHLLSRREDAEYVANIIVAWGGRYCVAV